LDPFSRIFAKAGYRIALIARRDVSPLADELKASGGNALPITLDSYTPNSFASAFSQIRSTWPNGHIRAAVFNTAFRVWKPFLEVTPAELQESLDTNITAAFAFAREAILAFKSNDENEGGKKGTLVFTGATAAIKGNKHTSAFAATKHGLRALSQSLAKEFGPQGIHVAHVSRFSASWSQCWRGLMESGVR
jgi:NAD(P)-dependent dehydrogenase (short-subunit alcohol dehydrogenase family)